MWVDELAAHGVDAPIGLGFDAEAFHVAGGFDLLDDGLLRLYGCLRCLLYTSRCV